MLQRRPEHEDQGETNDNDRRKQKNVALYARSTGIDKRLLNTRAHTHKIYFQLCP